MRKVIIRLSGIVLMAFVVVMTANASSGDPKDPKKATTEVSKDCSNAPAAAACAEKAEGKKCDESKTAEAKPCATEGKKCDNAKTADASKK